MKFINNYISEKLKITSDTKINKDYSNMNLNELINSIFPIEEHEDLWKNCKWCIDHQSKSMRTNYDKYIIRTFIKFKDDLIFELQMSFNERSYYGKTKIDRFSRDFLVINKKNAENGYYNDDHEWNYHGCKIIFKDTIFEKNRMPSAQDLQHLDETNSKDFQKYLEPFTDILNKYAKDNRVKNLDDLHIDEKYIK